MCLKLNAKTLRKKDFRGLAARLKWSEDEIEQLQKCNNPTVTLLVDWQVGNESTVDNLKKLLKEINRDDVIEILNEVLVLLAQTQIPRL